MGLVYAIFGFVFGLVIGSFLNVVIYRVPRHLSIVSPGSMCPSCGTEIAAYDNIPVLSWLILRGKCRHCGHPSSARYPLVELLTAIVFAAIGFVVGLTGLSIGWSVAAMIIFCLVAAVIISVVAIRIDGRAALSRHSE